MTGKCPKRLTGRSPATPLQDRPDGPTQDELLDEALEEIFPARDPTSVYRIG